MIVKKVFNIQLGILDLDVEVEATITSSKEEWGLEWDVDEYEVISIDGVTGESEQVFFHKVSEHIADIANDITNYE